MCHSCNNELMPFPPKLSLYFLAAFTTLWHLKKMLLKEKIRGLEYLRRSLVDSSLLSHLQ